MLDFFNRAPFFFFVIDGILIRFALFSWRLCFYSWIDENEVFREAF